MRAIRGDAQEPAPPAGVRGARSRCKQRAGERAATTDLGGAGRGEAAHVKHLVHARDAGGVPAERLVEGRRVLPRGRMRGTRCGAGCGLWEAARGERLWCARSMQGEGRV